MGKFDSVLGKKPGDKGKGKIEPAKDQALVPAGKGQGLVPSKGGAGQGLAKPGGSKTGVALGRPEPTAKALARPVNPADRRTLYQRVGEEEVAQPDRGARWKKRIAILLDATRSMDQLIQTAKERLRGIMEQQAREGGEIEIMLVVYRDYDMGPLVLEHSECTGDYERLVRWLMSVQTDGGGANLGEAVEVGLKYVFDNGPWDVIFVAGDEPSHPAEELATLRREKGFSTNFPTALELALQKGAQKRTPIYTFVVPGHHRQAETEVDFARISEASGAVSGKLDGSEAMHHMVSMALLVSGKPAAKARVDVERYLNAHQKALSAGASAFGQRLLEGGKK